MAKLRASGIEAQLISPDHRDAPDSTAARVATMHRAKGLEFDEVVIVGKAPSADPKTSFDHRRLLYVAMTRAKVKAILIKTGPNRCTASDQRPPALGNSKIRTGLASAQNPPITMRPAFPVRVTFIFSVWLC